MNEKDIEILERQLKLAKKEKQAQNLFDVRTVESVLNELEKYKLMLFMVVRNSKVLPVGIVKGKSLKEITDKTKETIKELEKMINFEKAKEFYDL